LLVNGKKRINEDRANALHLNKISN